MQVAHVSSEEGITEGQMLQLSACLEKLSSHPLAAVVLGRAAAMHLPLDAEVTNSHTMPGDPSELLTISQKLLHGTSDHQLLTAAWGKPATRL